MAAGKWSEFWRQEKSGFFKIMKMSTAVFAKRFIKEFAVDRNHKVLDFGCGPGFLIESLAEKGIYPVGLEINEYFVAECKRKFPRLSFFEIPDNPEGLNRILAKSLQNQKFDFIVLLSVSQYFDSKEVFSQTINSLKVFLNSNGKIIVADVITPNTSPIRDLLAVFARSVATGNTFNLFGFLRHLIFSDYRSLSKKKNLQFYSEEVFKKLAETAGLSYSITANLTLHPTRLNYIFKAPSDSRL